MSDQHDDEQHHAPGEHDGRQAPPAELLPTSTVKVAFIGPHHERPHEPVDAGIAGLRLGVLTSSHRGPSRPR